MEGLEQMSLQGLCSVTTFATGSLAGDLKRAFCGLGKKCTSRHRSHYWSAKVLA